MYKHTNLLKVSSTGDYEGVKYLVSNGADTSAQHSHAFRFASRFGHIDIVDYLVNNGADITALYHQALAVACELGNLDMVKYLISKGSDITADGHRAIRYALYSRQWKSVHYLVKLVLNEMKKYILFLMLNRGTINKDLIFFIPFDYIGYYKFYQEIRK